MTFFQNFHRFVPLQQHHNVVTNLSALEHASLTPELLLKRYTPLSCDLYHPKMIILTPQHTIQLIKQQIDINPKTIAHCRVILDEAHERKVEGDVLLSQLLQLRNYFKSIHHKCLTSQLDQLSFVSFYRLWGQLNQQQNQDIIVPDHLKSQRFDINKLEPLPNQLVLMSATPDDDLLQALGLYSTFTFDIPSQRLYDVMTLTHTLTTAPVGKDRDAITRLIINNAIWSLFDMHHPRLNANPLGLRRDLVTAANVEGLKTGFTPNYQHTPRGDILIFLAGMSECNLVKYQFKETLLQLQEGKHRYDSRNQQLQNHQQNQQSQRKQHQNSRHKGIANEPLVRALSHYKDFEIINIHLDFGKRGNAKNSFEALQELYTQTKNLIKQAYDNFMSNKKSSNNNNNNNNNIHKTTLVFVIPIAVCNIVSPQEKDYATKPLPSFLFDGDKYRLTKLILATSAIESSITIPNLSVMIDSGKSKIRTYDPDKQVSLLLETTITNDSRTQRSGRVGRVSSGTVITLIPAWEGSESLKCPQIQSIDITSKLIALRQYGLLLEQLKYLPTPILPKTLSNAKELCQKLGLLSPTDLKLTTKAITMLDFIELLNPVFATAIINQHYQLKFTEELTQQTVAHMSTPGAIPHHATASTLFFILVFIIMTSYTQEKVYSHNAFVLRASFDQYSDLVTILNTLIVYFANRSNGYFDGPGAKFRIERYLGLTESFTRETYNSLQRVANAIGIQPPYDPYFAALFNPHWQDMMLPQMATEPTRRQRGQQEILGIALGFGRLFNHGTDDDDDDDDDDEPSSRFPQSKFTFEQSQILSSAPNRINNPAILDPYILDQVINENNPTHLTSKFEIPTMIIPPSDNDFEYYNRNGYVPMVVPCTHQFISGSDADSLNPDILTNQLHPNPGLFTNDQLAAITRAIPNPILTTNFVDFVLQKVNSLVHLVPGLYKKPGEISHLDSIVLPEENAHIEIPEDILHDSLSKDLNRVIIAEARARYKASLTINDDDRHGSTITISSRPGSILPSFPKNCLLFGINADSSKKAMTAQLIHTKANIRGAQIIKRGDSSTFSVDTSHKRNNENPGAHKINPLALFSCVVPEIFNSSPFAFQLLNSVIRSVNYIDQQQKKNDIRLMSFPAFTELGANFITTRSFVEVINDTNARLQPYIPELHQGLIPQRYTFYHTTYTNIPTVKFYECVALVLQVLPYVCTSIVHIKPSVAIEQAFCPYTGQRTDQLWLHTSHEHSTTANGGNNNLPTILGITYHSLLLFLNKQRFIEKTLKPIQIDENDLFRRRADDTITNEFININDINSGAMRFALVLPPDQIEQHSFPDSFQKKLPWNSIFVASHHQPLLPWPRKGDSSWDDAIRLDYPNANNSIYDDDENRFDYSKSARICLLVNTGTTPEKPILLSSPQSPQPKKSILLSLYQLCGQIEWGKWLGSSKTKTYLLHPAPSIQTILASHIDPRLFEPEDINLAELLLTSGVKFHSQQDHEDPNDVRQQNNNIINFDGFPPIMMKSNEIKQQLTQSPQLKDNFKQFISQHPQFTHYVLDMLKASAQLKFDPSQLLRLFPLSTNNQLSSALLEDVPILQTIIVDKSLRFLKYHGYDQSLDSIPFDTLPSPPINNVPPKPIKPTLRLPPSPPTQPPLPIQPQLKRPEKPCPVEPKRQSKKANKKKKEKKNNNGEPDVDNVDGETNSNLDLEAEKQLDKEFKQSPVYRKYLTQLGIYEQQCDTLQVLYYNDMAIYQTQLDQHQTQWKSMQDNHDIAMSLYKKELQDHQEAMVSYKDLLHKYTIADTEHKRQVLEYGQLLKTFAQTHIQPLAKFYDHIATEPSFKYLNIDKIDSYDTFKLALDKGIITAGYRAPLKQLFAIKSTSKDNNITTSSSLHNFVGISTVAPIVKTLKEIVKADQATIVPFFTSENLPFLVMLAQLSNYLYICPLSDLSQPIASKSPIDWFFTSFGSAATAANHHPIAMLYVHNEDSHRDDGDDNRDNIHENINPNNSSNNSNDNNKNNKKSKSLPIITLSSSTLPPKYKDQDIIQCAQSLLDKQNLDRTMMISGLEVMPGISMIFTLNPNHKKSDILPDILDDVKTLLDNNNLNICFANILNKIQCSRLTSTTTLPFEWKLSPTVPIRCTALSSSAHQISATSIHPQMSSMTFEGKTSNIRLTLSIGLLKIAQPSGVSIKWGIGKVTTRLPTVDAFASTLEGFKKDAQGNNSVDIFLDDLSLSFQRYVSDLYNAMDMSRYKNKIDMFIRPKYVSGEKLTKINTNLIHSLGPLVMRMAQQLTSGQSSLTQFKPLDLIITPIPPESQFKITSALNLFKFDNPTSLIQVCKLNKDLLPQTFLEGLYTMRLMMGDDDDDVDDTSYIISTSSDQHILKRIIDSSTQHFRKLNNPSKQLDGDNLIQNLTLSDYTKQRFAQLTPHQCTIMTNNPTNKGKYAYNPLFTVQPDHNDLQNTSKMFCQGLCRPSQLVLPDFPSFYSKIGATRTLPLNNQTTEMIHTIPSQLGICLECCLLQSQSASERSTITVPHKNRGNGKESTSLCYSFDLNGIYNNIENEPVQASKVGLYKDNYTPLAQSNHPQNSTNTTTTTTTSSPNPQQSFYHAVTLPYPTMLTYFLMQLASQENLQKQQKKLQFKMKMAEKERQLEENLQDNSNGYFEQGDQGDQLQPNDPSLLTSQQPDLKKLAPPQPTQQQSVFFGAVKDSITELLFHHLCEIRYTSDHLLGFSRNIVICCPAPHHRIKRSDDLNYHLDEDNIPQQALLDVNVLRARSIDNPYKCTDTIIPSKDLSYQTTCSMIYCILCDVFHLPGKCEYTCCHRTTSTIKPNHTFNLQHRFELTKLNQETRPTPCTHPRCNMIYCISPECKRWHAKDDPGCDITRCPCSPTSQQLSKKALASVFKTDPQKTIYCSTCKKATYCSFCTSWHDTSVNCLRNLKLKQCPRCNVPTELRDGCNHITCPCGAHWCYRCESGQSPAFSTGHACYEHIAAAHTGGLYN